MFRPSILAFVVAAAALPALALAAPVTTPVPVAGAFETVESRGDFDVQVREGSRALVEVVAEPGWAERIQVEVDGGVLRLSRVNAFDSARGVVVKVVLPEFRATGREPRGERLRPPHLEGHGVRSRARRFGVG
jgi:hypothetical protein